MYNEYIMNRKLSQEESYSQNVLMYVKSEGISIYDLARKVVKHNFNANNIR